MKTKTAIITATLYLIVYVSLFQTGLSISVLSYLFLTSPFILVWMVYTVLKDNQHPYPELQENEEWGYTDKPKDQLGIF